MGVGVIVGETLGVGLEDGLNAKFPVEVCPWLTVTDYYKKMHKARIKKPYISGHSLSSHFYRFSASDVCCLNIFDFFNYITIISV